MQEVEITWGRAFKVWWSLFWRGVLFGGLAGFVAGFIIGFVGILAGIEREVIDLLSTIAGFLVSIPIGIWVVKWVLGKKFSDFRFALVSAQPGRVELPHPAVNSTGKTEQD